MSQEFDFCVMWNKLPEEFGLADIVQAVWDTEPLLTRATVLAQVGSYLKGLERRKWITEHGNFWIKPKGLKLPANDILQLVALMPVGSFTAGEVAGRLCLSPKFVPGKLKILIDKGYLSRSAEKAIRRSNFASFEYNLTQAGRAVRAKLVAEGIGLSNSTYQEEPSDGDI